ncbi:MAG TPA: spore germination protein, partial [Paenibacillaceae bacterium]|nr:spore germination protein [Paenibacillaceae bacterium]
GISSFIFPSFNISISIRILRFMMMILGASFGLYGIYIGLTWMVLHLSSLRSFGVPYMTPFAPFNIEDHKDSMLRLPWWLMVSRPRLLNQKDRLIRNKTHMPQPDPKGDKQEP